MDISTAEFALQLPMVFERVRRGESVTLTEGGATLARIEPAGAPDSVVEVPAAAPEAAPSQDEKDADDIDPWWRSGFQIKVEGKPVPLAPGPIWVPVVKEFPRVDSSLYRRPDDDE